MKSSGTGPSNISLKKRMHTKNDKLYESFLKYSNLDKNQVGYTLPY